MDQAARRNVGWGALVLLLVSAVHLTVGSYLNLSPTQLWRALVAGPSSSETFAVVVWNVRLVRLFAAVVVGATLSSGGACLQYVFRNPLAEPYIVGVSGGAAVGGALAVIFFATLFGTTVGAMIGGFLVLMLVMKMAPPRVNPDGSRLLLAGVLVGAAMSGMLTVLLLMAGQDTSRVLRWLLGSLSGQTWDSLALLTSVCLAGLAALVSLAPSLNLFAFGFDHARHSGVNASRVQQLTLLVVGVSSAATVGACGMIAFVGLIGPHLARRLVGQDLRAALPLSGLIGAAILVVADLIAQRLVGSFELPVGAVTALCGAPVLLLLLKPARG